MWMKECTKTSVKYETKQIHREIGGSHTRVRSYVMQVPHKTRTNLRFRSTVISGNLLYHPSLELSKTPFGTRKSFLWETGGSKTKARGLKVLGSRARANSFATKSISSSEQIFDRNKNSFVKSKEKLLHEKAYVNKFVAIIDGKIVDSDYDRSALAERVYTEHGYVQLFIGQVTKQKRYRELPSPERVKV